MIVRPLNPDRWALGARHRLTEAIERKLYGEGHRYVDAGRGNRCERCDLPPLST